jgi:hypothetical protein
VRRLAVRRRTVGVLVAVAMAVAASDALAQNGVTGQGAAAQRRASPGQVVPPGPGDAPLTAQQVEQEFDNFALGQAQRALNLNEGQFFRFARAYRALQGVRRRAQRQRRAMLGELGPLLRGPGAVADPPAVEARIAALDEQLVITAQEVRRAYGAIDRVLNLRQRGRFRQFEQQMELKKLELLARAQAGARGGGPLRLPR